MHEIGYDRGRHRVTVRRWGYSDLAEVEAYGREMAAMLARVARPTSPIDILFDVSDAMPLSQEAAAAQSRISAFNANQNLGRVAFLFSSELMRFQARRILPYRNCKHFLVRDEAESWLDDIDRIDAAAGA